MRILTRAHGSNEWEVAESVKGAEAGLQALLVDSPLLIPIQEIREDVSPLVVAVAEFGLPGSGATDILAFSPDGDVAILECKLAANPQSRREVIGQILEYAAYLWEMTYEDVTARVQSRKEQALAELVEEAVSAEWDEESFREGVADSLKSGDFMLIVVVDEINDELRRIIRYVNECSESAFSLHAMELRRFQTAGLEVLVPHLHGVSSRKAGPKRTRWTEERFFGALSQTLEEPYVKGVRGLYAWSVEVADRVWFGTGAETGSFTFHYRRDGKALSVFTVYTDGRFSLNYGWLSRVLNENTMQRMHDRVHVIGPFSTIPADFSKWPSVMIVDVLRDAASVDEFKKVVEWLGENARVEE
jgi:hypothetical protein